jgi:hypothetical protein
LSGQPVAIISHEPVAQLVEHRTFNAVVAGSSPARLTNKINRLLGIPEWSDTDVWYQIFRGPEFTNGMGSRH